MGTTTFDADGIILVYARLAGVTKTVNARLIVDTGSTYSMIPEEMQHALGIDTEEKRQMVTATGEEEVAIGSVDSIEVAGCKQHSVSVVVRDLPHTSYADGLLGLNFLRNYSVHINFQQGRFRLSS